MFSNITHHLHWSWRSSKKQVLPSIEKHLVDIIEKLQDIVRGGSYYWGEHTSIDVEHQSSSNAIQVEDDPISANNPAATSDEPAQTLIDNVSRKFKWELNPSIRKLYEWTGPIEVLGAAAQFYFMNKNKEFDHLIPEEKFSSLSEDEKITTLEVWIELILMSVMLTAGVCDMLKKSWPHLMKQETAYPFSRGGILDNLYQMLGRVEGVVGAATLGLYGYKNVKNAWKWLLPTLGTSMALSDLGMEGVAKFRRESPLPEPVKDTLNTLLKTECIDTHDKKDHKRFIDWVKSFHPRSVIENPDSSNVIAPSGLSVNLDLKTYAEAEQLLKSLQEIQQDIEQNQQDKQTKQSRQEQQAKQPKEAGFIPGF